MLIAIISANIFSSACFSDTGRSRNDEILCCLHDLLFEREVELDMLSLVGLHKVDSWIQLERNLIVLRFLTVCKKTERTSFIFQNEEFFSFGGIICKEDLLSVNISPYDDSKGMDKFHIIFWREFLLIPNLFNLIDVEQQTICFSNIIYCSSFLFWASSIDIDELRQ